MENEKNINKILEYIKSKYFLNRRIKNKQKDMDPFNFMFSLHDDLFDFKDFEFPTDYSQYRVYVYIPSDIEDENITLDELKVKLDDAVKSEKYELAIKYRDMIANYGNKDSNLEKLKNDLQVAIDSQNFEEAIILRDKISEYNKKAHK